MLGVVIAIVAVAMSILGVGIQLLTLRNSIDALAAQVKQQSHR
ncbi:MAG: hypothetical protein AB7U20_19995 [Planctomycetaceae bacterium]